MTDYTKYQNKAFAKVQKYGSPFTVKKAGKKVYDKDTGTYTDTGETYTGVALQFTFDQKDIDGTNIKFADVKFMAVVSGNVQSNDTVTFDGKSYTVIAARPLNLNGKTDIYWTIQAR